MSIYSCTALVSLSAKRQVAYAPPKDNNDMKLISKIEKPFMVKYRPPYAQILSLYNQTKRFWSLRCIKHTTRTLYTIT